ncbi:hypothetical protein FRC01_013346, partial [Tulasnella sp. 417]
MANGNIDEFLEKAPQVSDNLRLKLENVLISDSLEAILCDFGLARLDDEESTGLTTTKSIKGAPRYMSPELFDDGEVHTFSSDIWAYGCLILKLQIIRAILIKQLPASGDDLDGQDNRLKPLLERCWDFDPLARPSARECDLYLPEVDSET